MSLESYNDLEYIDGYFYAASNKDNRFYRFDKNICEEIYRFKDEESTENLFLHTAVVGEYIVFSPYAAKNVYLYNYKNGKIISFPIEEGEETSNFFDVIADDRFVYLLPIKYHSLIKIDITDFTLEYLREPVTEISKRINCNWPGCVSGYLIDGKLHMLSLCTSLVVTLNKNISSIVDYMESVGRICGMNMDADEIVMLYERGICIIRNNEIFLTQIKYELNADKHYFQSIKNNNEIVFFPYKKFEGICPIRLLMDGKSYKTEYLERDAHDFVNCKQIGKYTYLFAKDVNCLARYDNNNHMLEYNFLGELNKTQIENKNFKLNNWMKLL